MCFSNLTGTMDICSVIASFAALLCVTVIIVAGHEQIMGKEEVLSIARCVATCADQPLCDELLGCYSFFPQPHKGLFYECQKKHLPGVGRCTKTEQLFISEELREKVYLCVLAQLPKELTEEQEKQMDKYK
ncbi:hypothetical protein TNCT_277291, partial [Trichonephila clavata]